MRLSCWPTLLVAASIHVLFFSLTLYWARLPWPLLVILGGITVAWHSSLEHEVIHGHPFARKWINRLLVPIPMILWLPYESYAKSHHKHHCDHTLTDPFEDPESFYFPKNGWKKLAAWQKQALTASNTLIGRLTIGVVLVIFGTLRSELNGFLSGARRVWFYHGLKLLGLSAYLLLVCAMPLWVYFLSFVFPGTSVLMLRSFLEHQYAQNPKQRTAIVDASWFWRLIFLNNCYHSVHHEHPALPWYKLRQEYLLNAKTYCDLNNGYIHNGYFNIMSEFALKPKEKVQHPQR